jgi:type VI secretion system protein ImpK
MGPRSIETAVAGYFHEFYRELLELKRKAAKGAFVPGHADDAELRSGAADKVWNRVVASIEGLDARVAASGRSELVAVWPGVKYAMAALADDIFLHIDWPGRASWQLVEARLFQTRRAGEDVFRRIDELMRSVDPHELALAPIYMQVLALGFEGKLRGTPACEAALASYRSDLARLCERGDGLPERGEELMPEAYAATAAGEQIVRRRRGRGLLIAGAVMIGLWVAVAHPLWRHAVQGLEPAVDSLRRQQVGAWSAAEIQSDPMPGGGS